MIYDITFCMDHGCPNKECKRHPDHLREVPDMVVSMAMFVDCEDKRRFLRSKICNDADF